MKTSVLLVDDQPATRRSIRNLLESGGYDVIEAGDESSAWDAARTYHSRIGLFLIDVELLGVKSGAYLAVGLRTMLNVPVVFMSAHRREMLISNDHLSVSAPFIQKPFKIHEIHEVVASALGPRTPLTFNAVRNDLASRRLVHVRPSLT